jgi:hypothetical protein
MKFLLKNQAQVFILIEITGLEKVVFRTYIYIVIGQKNYIESVLLTFNSNTGEQKNVVQPGK